MTGNREAGSALVTAVIGVAVFSLLALEMLDASRASFALVRAQADRARLSAAADAGVAMAIHDLGLSDPSRRLAADGQSHAAFFDGVNLSITVQDETGKIGLNRVGPDVERHLLAAAGIGGDRLDILVDSLEDWKDADAMARPNGAELDYYARLGIRPRDGDIRTLDELATLRGMDATLLARLAPAITLFASRFATFDSDVAGPLALAAMSQNGGLNLPGNILSWTGGRTALQTRDDKDMFGRMFSITVAAWSGEGARTSQTVIVEFTGDPADPYWVRYAH